MSQWDKFRARLLGGRSDNNIDFDRLCNYLKRLGLNERIEGSHHTFTLSGVEGLVELQPRADGSAKAYQVKQARTFILDNGL